MPGLQAKRVTVLGRTLTFTSGGSSVSGIQDLEGYGKNTPGLNEIQVPHIA